MKNGYEIETFDSAEPYRIQMTQIKKFNLHWHSYIEIFYVKKGRIRLQTGDFSFHLDEGHICFINSNTIHSVNQTDLENQIMILQIPTDSGRPFFTLRNYKFNSTTYLSDFSKDAAPLNEFRALLENIYKESELKSAGYNQIILGYINTLLGLMIRRFYLIPKTDEDFTAEKNLARLSEIISYLEEHYTEKLSLQILADRLHINYYYLSHFFKNTAGISFQDYLNNLRVDKSLPLLAEADNNITDIALDSGFSNIKAYTKAFREKFGMLPSAYRKIISSSLDPDTLNEEKLLHLYSGQTHSATKEDSPLNLYHKLNLTQKENRVFSLDYFISENPTHKSLDITHAINIDKQAFMDTPVCALRKICTDLSINEISICGSNFTDHEQIFFKHKTNLLNLMDLKFTTASDLKETSPSTTDSAVSMIGALDLVHRFLDNPTTALPCCMSHLAPINENKSSLLLPDNSPLRFLSSSFQTSFGCYTPLFYAEYFLKKLHGSLIFHSDGCVIYKHENCYQILCYHKKSLQMYQSLTTSEDYSKENYSFFVNSFPHMKYSFSFNSILTRIQQTTFTLSEDYGSIFSNWQKAGAPEQINAAMADYLTAVTKPSITTVFPPFEEKPFISIELPPLAIAYVELKLLV